MRSGCVNLHPDAVPGAVAFDVCRESVADQVVAAVFLLNLRKRLAEIAQIEECVAAGVG